MLMLIRIVITSLPLIALPALAAQTAVVTGITTVRPAMFLFSLAGALLLALVFRSTASHVIAVATAKIGELRIRRVLRQRTSDVLHDVIIPGAYGGLTKLDHAILTSGGILCIRTRHYHGIVFGGEDEPQWTNVDGTTRRRFLNPVIQNEGRTRALRNIVPDVPVANLVVFTGNVEFPTPPPANVIRVADLDSYISKFVFGPSKIEDWNAAWMTVNAAILRDEDSRKDFQAQIA